MNPFTLVEDDGLSDPVYAATVKSVEQPIGQPPCECVDCQNGFYTVKEQEKPGLSYHRRLSDTDAERRVLSAMEKIWDGKRALTEQLNVFADVLMSRWNKRSQAKREALLKEAAPDLEERQWLVPRYTYLRERLYVHARPQRRRRQLLLPWLNVEVLKTNPAVLFALLHYRTAYSPQHWAAFDSGQLTLSWAAGFLDVDFSAKCVVMYGPKYGSLVDWEGKAAHRADTIGFPRASLILDGVDISQPSRIDKWRHLVSNAAFKDTGVVEFWSPYTNQAFSPPPEFDSKYLLSLAKTRLDATGDHLWYLQCDAAYMRRHLKIMFATEIFKKASDSHKGQMLVRRIRSEVRSHHWWHWIEMECRYVDALRDRFRDSVYPGAILPIDYDRALGALELLLVNQVIYRASCLEELLPYVPGLQEHWSLEPTAGLPNAIGFLLRKKSANTQESLTNDRLDWCLVQLLAKPDDQRTFDHSMLFAMLQEHMSKNPSEKARLDEVIYQVLSDLASCHEMLLAVRFHRPQNAPRTVEEVKRTEDRHAWRRRPRFSNDVEGFGVVPQGIGMSLVKNFYLANTPVGPKNSVWLAQSRQLRATLEKFWELIRQTIQEDFKDSDFSPAEVDSLLEVVSANLSGQYLQDKQREDNAILAVIHEQDAPQPVTNYFDGAESCPAATTIIPRLEKTKTRGNPRPSADDITPACDGTTNTQVETAAVVKGTTIKVAKQWLDNFLMMFPEKDDTVKDVLWDRFVHAMVDAGFTARNNGGSQVSFKKLDGEGKIVFHKPHPGAKIDPVMLRAMGQRMAKWFGWRRELFVLRGDTTQA
ncbi:hypothetical protein MGU_09539 [Metarhizium guizhouense ARSEF 977]|uniref:Uncharacterized protein n=1 Tax=Metarhizium guizhouense (strain ARSEF 977) TaxID=1276136 RepID=A0A0B4H088_METGA|nr:hypothetical protein MGU_09539 [Metarhizium guizhouense ARSEF 977]